MKQRGSAPAEKVYRVRQLCHHVPAGLLQKWTVMMLFEALMPDESRNLATLTLCNAVGGM